MFFLKIDKAKRYIYHESPKINEGQSFILVKLSKGNIFSLWMAPKPMHIILYICRFHDRILTVFPNDGDQYCERF